jgi:hypothetical protein
MSKDRLTRQDEPLGRASAEPTQRSSAGQCGSMNACQDASRARQVWKCTRPTRPADRRDITGRTSPARSSPARNCSPHRDSSRCDAIALAEVATPSADLVSKDCHIASPLLHVKAARPTLQLTVVGHSHTRSKDDSENGSTEDSHTRSRDGSRGHNHTRRSHTRRSKDHSHTRRKEQQGERPQPLRR